MTLKSIIRKDIWPKFTKSSVELVKLKKKYAMTDSNVIIGQISLHFFIFYTKLKLKVEEYKAYLEL